MPFRVVDQRAGIDIDIAIRCFGEYSYHIVNPILFTPMSAAMWKTPTPATHWTASFGPS